MWADAVPQEEPMLKRALHTRIYYIAIVNMYRFLSGFALLFFIMYYFIFGYLIPKLPGRAELTSILRGGVQLQSYVPLTDSILMVAENGVFIQSPTGKTEQVPLFNLTREELLAAGKITVYDRDTFVLGGKVIAKYTDGKVVKLYESESMDIMKVLQLNNQTALTAYENGKITAYILDNISGSVTELSGIQGLNLIDMVYKENKLYLAAFSTEGAMASTIVFIYDTGRYYPDAALVDCDFLAYDMKLTDDNILLIGNDGILCYNYEGDLTDRLSFSHISTYSEFNTEGASYILFDEAVYFNYRLLRITKNKLAFIPFEQQAIKACAYGPFVLLSDGETLYFYDDDLKLKRSLKLDAEFTDIYVFHNTDYLTVIDGYSNIRTYYLE